METGLRPALTKKSTNTDFSLVWPDLKSSPPIKTLAFSAISIQPGTKVFWGDPLINAHCNTIEKCMCWARNVRLNVLQLFQYTPSKMLATANNVEGEISLASFLMERIKFSAVSFSPGTMSAKRSVLAVHSKITLSKACSLTKQKRIDDQHN